MMMSGCAICKNIILSWLCLSVYMNLSFFLFWIFWGKNKTNMYIIKCGRFTRGYLSSCPYGIVCTVWSGERASCTFITSVFHCVCRQVEMSCDFSLMCLCWLFHSIVIVWSANKAYKWQRDEMKTEGMKSSSFRLCRHRVVFIRHPALTPAATTGHKATGSRSFLVVIRWRKNVEQSSTSCK